MLAIIYSSKISVRSIFKKAFLNISWVNSFIVVEIRLYLLYTFSSLMAFLSGKWSLWCWFFFLFLPWNGILFSCFPNVHSPLLTYFKNIFVVVQVVNEQEWKYSIYKASLKPRGVSAYSADHEK